MITKDGRDTPIEKLTAENYVVPKGEERSYHCVIEVEQFDQKTGAKISQPRVQKFGKKIFETHVQASLRKQGYKVTILHDPNEWIKANQELAEKREMEALEAKAKAEKEKFDAAVSEAVAKALAEKEKEIAASEQAKIDAAVADAVAKALAEKANDETTNAPEDSAKEQAKKPGRPAKETKE